MIRDLIRFIICETVRKPYILYRRQSGKKEKPKRELPYYVAFWDEERREYRDRRCTNQTNEYHARQQAEKWLKEGVPSLSQETFYDYLGRFWAPEGEYARICKLRGRNLSAAYLVSMQTAIDRHVLPYLKEARRDLLLIGQVTPALLEELVLRLADSSGLSAGRINGIRQAVSVPLAEAKRLGKISHNPIANVLRLKEEKPSREILSLQEARRFFALEWEDARLRLINMLAASTGMRLGECRGLLREDIVRAGEDCEILVRHNWQDDEGLKAPKWNSVRSVPVPEKVAGALLELAEANPWRNDFVFYGYDRDRPISKIEVSKAFNEAVCRIGIPEVERRRRKLTFHSWRHWYVSYLRGSIQDHALRQLTRHRTEKILDRYSHITEEQRQAVAKLGKSLF